MYGKTKYSIVKQNKVTIKIKKKKKSSSIPQFKSISFSAVLTVQLSHPYMTTGKTIALTRRTLVSKVMSLLFNMLSRLVVSFLPRSKCLLIILLLLYYLNNSLFIFYFFYFYFIFLYNTVLVLPYIDMNQPWVYMSSQS